MALYAWSTFGMSASDTTPTAHLDTDEATRQLIDQWAGILAQVLESMTDQRPAITWRPIDGLFDEIASDADFLWWEQPLHISADALVWVGAPRATWDHAGTLTLRAAGLETVEPSEARNTWLEILGQSLSALARSVGMLLGREVTCDTGRELNPGPQNREWAQVAMSFGDNSLPPLLFGFSARLRELILTPSADTDGASKSGNEGSCASAPAFTNSRTMNLLMGVDLPVSISFGKTQLPMRDVLKLTTGSIVELNRGVNEPVEVLVNRCLVARGEVVVVDGNYGVRIQEIASRQDRLRSLR
jgi:flagellar motor switch protein FliN/FliY